MESLFLRSKQIKNEEVYLDICQHHKAPNNNKKAIKEDL